MNDSTSTLKAYGVIFPVVGENYLKVVARAWMQGLAFWLDAVHVPI
jgi:hypothetical protein